MTPRGQRRIVSRTIGHLKITSNWYSHVSHISSPLDTVWLAMPGPFESLSIPISTKLETMFQALAKPVSFSREYSQCSTRGVLEQRLAEAVKAQRPQ